MPSYKSIFPLTADDASFLHRVANQIRSYSDMRGGERLDRIANNVAALSQYTGAGELMPQSDELIERVARIITPAVWAQEGRYEKTTAVHEWAKEQSLKKARAVLKEMTHGRV
jgi:hypothetical protein